MKKATDSARRRLLAGLAGAGTIAGVGGPLDARPGGAGSGGDASAEGRAVRPPDAARAEGIASALPAPPTGVAPDALAADEAFWADVARHYDRTEEIVDLEHGYWGRMARPVQQRYLDAIRQVDAQGAWYARREYADDHREAVRRVARSLGAHEDEIVLTRNATEAVHSLVRQHRHLSRGDAVLYADVDYPAFKRLMASLKEWRGVQPVRITLPPRASREAILDRYLRAFDAHPNLRLMLATHASNQHGLVLPMAEIAAAARARGIDVVCDAAQSWGLLDLRIADLGVDWAGFNLHKWIGAPLGLGVLYMRRGSLDAIAPYPGESDPDGTRAAARIHTGTANFAAVLAIPAALDFHDAIGGANKEARLRYLRRRWTSAAATMAHVEVLGGTEEGSWSGIGAFRLRGHSDAEAVRALQRRLTADFGVFTVVRYGLASGACVRVTPQVFTTPAEIDRLVDALAHLSA